MKLKKILSTILVSSMVITSLVSCSNGSDSDVAKTENDESAIVQNEDQVTIKVLAAQSTTDAGIEEFITEAVKEKYPNINIEWECIGWEDLQVKMQLYLQSGLPDIVIGKAQDVQTYSELDILEEITDSGYITEVLDASLPGVTKEGKVLGLPYNAQYQGVYYNKAIFEELGLKVPNTQEELAQIIDVLNENDITPFATHMVDTWSIGNVTMQFAVNEVFRNTPDWGDKFRAGEVSFSTSDEYKRVYEYNKLLYDNTWSDKTFSLEQTACDAQMVLGDAAMKVSGSWSIQNFLDIDEDFDFGIFPFPNETGDAKLLFEPNITFMKMKNSDKQEAVDKFFEVIATDKDLALEICNYTKTASMIKDVTPTYLNPSQIDVDKYVDEDRIIDVNVGNNQLTWGGFQDENAKDIAEYLQGTITLEQALSAADARRDISR